MKDDKKNQKPTYPYTTPEGITLHRDYCFLIDGSKYNRNIACKFHDNAYGIHGGGDAKKRYELDKAFYDHLKKNNDPMAFWAYLAVRLFGWLFFNYTKKHYWKGQLGKMILRRIFPFLKNKI